MARKKIGSGQSELRLLPAVDAAETQGPNDEATQVLGYSESIEVPIAFAQIQPLSWEDDEQVFRALKCITVEANIATPETVSVSLSSFLGQGSGGTEGLLGMVYLELDPADALVLAEELERAAVESVAGLGPRHWRGTAQAQAMEGPQE
jgi:hypothetical protein